ncbi:MAG: hypothetical protein II811_08685, partial [Spirochaetaceae bacterium]|nr:hypothetical protein [Spirochaetaceae bacterium]
MDTTDETNDIEDTKESAAQPSGQEKTEAIILDDESETDDKKDKSLPPSEIVMPNKLSIIPVYGRPVF